ncbi:MAG: redox-regulated ATPase YchF [Candidatus Yanofskybacteria bacterium RIFCSPHIGHO2_02_FULL_39_10]|uniref:Ribosome-binding ATPase YchF n=1 Tax=Candidatus Yanofskybacteria bacterium RIFCSPHIGHO2_02_FULL_39_10 TaxID=1802674 RepID=A0A1F8F6R2_9BACT|nr:MAG: redox-regulated ATPase YchF [Candidatus Yanofskybacteria bacterium RIFCSPHIGHO2_02_FULL_39_10]
MSLSIGIVGLPNVGKSTLFKALTNVAVDIQNYPFTTINPNVGVVEVPDQRVDALTLMSNSKKKIYATVEFTDIAGLVKGASQGEGLGNKFLANIREVDAIAQVVRAFEDTNITHVHNRINPAEDIEIINTELIFADIETVEKRIIKSEKESKTPTPEGKKATADLIILAKFKQQLDSGRIISKLDLNENEDQLAKELSLLTAKKFIYVINVSENQLTDKWTPDEKLLNAIGLPAQAGKSPFVVMCNKLELTLSDITLDEKKEFLAEFNLPESGLDTLVKIGYETLGLLTFLTTGEDETRAWTTHVGDPIPKASRAIHTDFERLFIRAEVINWKDLLGAESHANARSKGLIRTVGRDYIIQEGDVVEILIGK